MSGKHFILNKRRTWRLKRRKSDCKKRQKKKEKLELDSQIAAARPSVVEASVVDDTVWMASITKGL